MHVWNTKVTHIGPFGRHSLTLNRHHFVRFCSHVHDYDVGGQVRRIIFGWWRTCVHLENNATTTALYYAWWLTDVKKRRVLETNITLIQMKTNYQENFPPFSLTLSFFWLYIITICLLRAKSEINANYKHTEAVATFSSWTPTPST
jgi:hypothetical protein